MADYRLCIAAVFKNEAPYLAEWIEYHRMAGVDHFWLYDNISDDDSVGAIRPYVDAGIVEIIEWRSPPEPLAFQASQVYAYQDALRRATGATSWLALIDTDEFMLPMRETSIPACLDAHFADASAVYMSWRHFGTGGVTVPIGDPMLLKLTACAPRLHPDNATGKSIVRPDCVRVADVFTQHFHPLDPASRYFNGDAEPLAFRTPLELDLDGRHHSQWIRLNHYTFRDERFFHAVKLPRLRAWGVDEALIWEHYETFSRSRDVALPTFIEHAHPDDYRRFWARGL